MTGAQRDLADQLALRFAAMFEQSPDACMLLDENLLFVDCNRSALELFGVQDKAALIGLSPITLSPKLQPDGRSSEQSVQEVLARVEQHGSHRFEWLLKRADGRAVIAEAAVTWLMIDGKRQLFASAHDATQRKAAEQDVLRSREAAIEASRLKSQFLANMSHEIRTPMHGVLGMLALALGTELTAEQREYLGAARASAEALLDIINDILDLSKLEAGKLTIEQAELSLEEALQTSLTTTALRAHAKGLELVVEVDRDVPPSFVGDSLRIRQVLINLIGNAIKFTETGQVKVRVSRSEEQGSPRVHFAVEDSGIGIAPDRQASIFDAFQQADNSTTRRYGGTGLGLTICKELVQRMGGRLALSSVEGQGSTFSFSIPLKTAGDKATTPRVQLLAYNVLIVDDHEGARRALASQLEAMGATVAVAASPHEAVLLVRETRGFNAVFIDHRLDDSRDGIELAHKLRGLRACAHARFVLLRSNERVGRDALSQAGFSFALDKPVLAGDITRALTAPIESTPSTSRYASLPAREEPKTKLPRLSVLVVEDHPVNSHFMTSLLRRWGQDVVHASNGANALAACRNQRFDVILMDVQMPVMDGLEATRRIRAGETGKRRIPIIALTANAMKGDEEECLRAGMDVYLSKPIEPDLLFETLSRFAGNARPSSDKIEIQGLERVRTAPSPNEQAPFAHDALLQRAAGDPRFEADLIRIFVDSQDEMMREVESAVSRQDSLAVRHAAHRLKGALQLVCAGPAASVALELERAGREGRVASFLPTFERLRREMVRLRRALGDFVAPLSMGPPR
ncbi:MAG TPA: response regulator [Polyangiales bacterium]